VEREFARWMRQARRNLESAELDLARGYYEWACFKAQQAAELAVKALLRARGVAKGGHSVLKLIEAAERELSLQAPGEVKEVAAELDHFYPPPRCPDVYDEGNPFEYFTESMAMRALEHARRVIKWVEAWSVVGSPGLF